MKDPILDDIVDAFRRGHKPGELASTPVEELLRETKYMNTEERRRYLLARSNIPSIRIPVRGARTEGAA
jgi:hypothetical protein